MAKCKCGSRPKRGAPPLSVLRLQDVALPLFNFGSNPFQVPPSPPGFSAIWAEDTVVFCARDPDRLYLEFPPYEPSVLTAALKRLWGQNCECLPVRGVYRSTFTYTLTGCDNLFGCATSSYSTNGTHEGAAIGMRMVKFETPTRVEIYWYGYRASNGYATELLISSNAINADYGASGSSTFKQEKVSEGCYVGPVPDPPLKPPSLPDPYPVDPPPALPPDYFIPDPKIPRYPPPFLPPAECCDCC